MKTGLVFLMLLGLLVSVARTATATSTPRCFGGCYKDASVYRRIAKVNYAACKLLCRNVADPSACRVACKNQLSLIDQPTCQVNRLACKNTCSGATAPSGDCATTCGLNLKQCIALGSTSVNRVLHFCVAGCPSGPPGVPCRSSCAATATTSLTACETTFSNPAFNPVVPAGGSCMSGC